MVAVHVSWSFCRLTACAAKLLFMVSSMARILSSGGVHFSLLAVSASERVRLVVTLISCREFGGLSLVESIITDLSVSSQSYTQSFAGLNRGVPRGGGEGGLDPPPTQTYTGRPKLKS